MLKRSNQPRQRIYSARKPRSTSKALKWSKLLFLIVVLVAVGLLVNNHLHKTSVVLVPKPPTTTKSLATLSPATTASTAPATITPSTTTSTNPCSTNGLSKLVLVSISQRHLWACSGSTDAYSSPVITGMDFLAADLTPTGTYHIYGKITNTVLRGSDSTGSWNDPVSYWMPFLDNKYGEYGFHDATWRPDNAFGNVSPSSTNASHGCVECPLATAAWLYSWAPIGTTVTIES